VDEARTQAALRHPGVLPVLGAGAGPHGPYLATALVDGVTLRQLARARALGVRRALALLEQVADALDAVHLAGVVHRDVKPSNVLVDGEDRAYLADFGVAQRAGTPQVAGGLTGTAAYLAPELALGEPATAASDRYAFAAVAYECLTGEVPFPREADAAVLFAHVDQPPPSACDRAPELPEGFDAVLRAGLAKDPGDRPASAAGLVAALREELPEARARRRATSGFTGRLRGLLRRPA
jgi:serine/threonine protein kinase